MARYIYCEKCFTRFRNDHPGDESHYPEEIVRTKKGFALFDMECDHCSKKIALGDLCGAVTAERKDRQTDMWEYEFIVIEI